MASYGDDRTATCFILALILPGLTFAAKFVESHKSLRGLGRSLNTAGFASSKSHMHGSRFLDADDDDCLATTYSVGIEGGPFGKFILPVAKVGVLKQRPCVFKGESYKKGAMNFTCRDSGWAFANHSCKERQKVTNQCQFTTHTFTLNTYPGSFSLPLSNDGSVEERACVFQGETYTKGKLKFACSNGKWRHESNTCSHPLSGKCPPTGYDFKLAGHRERFQLPVSQNGAKKQEKCVFDGKTFAQGMVTFICTDGKWAYASHTCSDTPAGGCGKIAFTVTVSNHTGVFALPPIEDGKKHKEPCKFKGKAYAQGFVEFTCERPRWKFSGHSCADPKPAK